MKKLHMGTDAIAINDVIIKLQKSIEELAIKKRKVRVNSYAGTKIIRSYEEKIRSQSDILNWLEKAL